MNKVNVHLEEITEHNWYEATQLRVSEEQLSLYPCPIVYWIAESKYATHFCLKAIYADEVMVGFLIYNLDPDDGEYWITTFMIDERFQRKGYALQALTEFIHYFKNKYDTDKIKLGHRANNVAAANLYEMMGFHINGEIIGDEIVRCYSLK
ncbi:GNAT family N-acetyltransferase [Paenibacillus sp. P32E]|uniref:GNAT family N-acetyltransferase n=1 Tax=Paenibacillus sp. P32E TaxID=1349434 RepID=UPI00093E160E|nr:GNAT family N-acetyltransferase [Paenibacillus sp. P32E]OKP94749.1 hypothetical protein A3848_01890 [Paenibacillus sp. P32E]